MLSQQSDLDRLIAGFKLAFEEHTDLSWNSQLGALDRLRPILKELDGLPKGRLLDVGSGYGCLSSLAAAQGFEVSAVDSFVHIPDPLTHTYNITFRECNIEAETLPYPDHSFDVVTLAHVLDLINFSPLAALKDIARVLKPGGYLYITVPNVTYYGNLLSLLNGRSIYFHEFQTYSDPPPSRVRTINGQKYVHKQCRLYTAAELSEIVQLSGLSIVKSSFIAPSPLPTQSAGRKLLRYARRWLTNACNWHLLGSIICVVARKDQWAETTQSPLRSQA